MTVRARIFRVDLPLARAIPVKGRTAESRVILRMELEDDDGSIRWADCSPLPGFHKETLEECLNAAQSCLAASAPFPSSSTTASISDSAPALPSTQHLPMSLQTTLAILEWQKSIPPLGSGMGYFENSALIRIPERADYDAVLESVQEARVCKVKVRLEDKSRAHEFLRILSEARQDRELRIDCNQALASEDFAAIEGLIRGLPVAYVEEPASDLRLLKIMASAFPLALDESLGLDAELDGLAKAWVIKPNRLGWADSLRRFAHPGPQAKVLSNVFESLTTLQLYAWAYRQAVKTPEACGLGTAFYMQEDAAADAWNPKVYQGPWPKAAIAPRVRDHHEVLLWEH